MRRATLSVVDRSKHGDCREQQQGEMQVVFIPCDDSRPLQPLVVESETEIAKHIILGVERQRDDALLLDDEQIQNVIGTLLVRSEGMRAHHNPTDCGSSCEPNVRGTRLAMACGLLSMRLRGNVIVSRSGRTTLNVEDISAAACGSYDLRRPILEELLRGKDDYYPTALPLWMTNASREHYHDAAVLQRLATVMTNNTARKPPDDDDDDASDESSGNSCGCGAEDEENSSKSAGGEKQSQETTAFATTIQQAPSTKRTFVTTVPLCLECRRPASELCPNCEGAYFCATSTAQCRAKCWSHDCLCPTWKIYTQRRTELSTFPPYLGPWCEQLTRREFQLSERPYADYLTQDLGVSLLDNTTTTTTTTSWWLTETQGWKGGESESAQLIQLSTLQRRLSFAEGFHPVTGLPEERPVSAADITECGIQENRRNEVGFLRLSSWDEYYRLRKIPSGSPVALLLTFPLTLYYAIVQYGEVPCTVARMLNRPLRIHIVGVEKEINFLDLFKEVSFLLPVDFLVELVFVVRDDMLPPALRASQLCDSSKDKDALSFDLTETLQISITSGVYGASLDPNFDCGSGPPDLLVAFNAGLYAYDSWRSVVNYLDQQRGVVGVFTDYNEFSGVQCASVGGNRDSLTVNPFRQPRAMPVYSMNLPQFSNGFLYVFNPAVID